MRWILNNIVINGFTYIVFGTALGTIVYLIWKLAGRWSEKRGYVDISYWIWKVVLLSFGVRYHFCVIKDKEKWFVWI